MNKTLEIVTDMELYSTSRALKAGQGHQHKQAWLGYSGKKKNGVAKNEKDDYV